MDRREFLGAAVAAGAVFAVGACSSGGRGARADSNVATLANFSQPEPVAAAGGEWINLPTPPVTARAQATWCSNGELVLFAGGQTWPGAQRLNDAALFDPRINEWRRTAQVPEAAAGETHAVWDGERFFLLSSDDSEHHLFDYSVVEDKWTRRAPAGVFGFQGLDLVLLPDGRLLGLSGAGGDRVMGPFGQLYDPDNDRWVTLPEPPLANYRSRPIVDGRDRDELRVWFIGGSWSEGGQSIDRFEPTRGFVLRPDADEPWTAVDFGTDTELRYGARFGGVAAGVCFDEASQHGVLRAIDLDSGQVKDSSLPAAVDEVVVMATEQGDDPERTWLVSSRSRALVGKGQRRWLLPDNGFGSSASAVDVALAGGHVVLWARAGDVSRGRMLRLPT